MSRHLGKIMVDLKHTLNLALRYHKANQLEQADVLYRKILAHSPNHPDVLHRLGMLSIQTGRNEDAVLFVKNAIKNKKNAPNFHVTLAVALQNLGRNKEVVDACVQAIMLKPDSFHAYNTLGNALKALGEFDKAVESFRKAIELRPDIAEIYFNLANTFRERGDLGEAVAGFLKAIDIRQDYAEAYNYLGNILSQQDKLDAAKVCYEKALQINPGYVEVLYNLGNVLVLLKRYDEAVLFYQKAVRLNPDFAEAYCNLGKSLAVMGKQDEAVINYEKALDLRPGFAEAYNGIGNVFREKGETEEALASYKRALELKSDFAEVYYNISNVFLDQGKVEEALENCRRSLAIKPDLAEAHWNTALALLTTGEFEEGWRRYEWRFLKKDASIPPFNQTDWNGSSLKGKTILVCAEQGVGDEIMFASCLREVIVRAELCVVECDGRLVPLFGRSFPNARMIGRINNPGDKTAELPPMDVKIAIGSLPKFFRPGFSDFPEEKSYLMPDREKKKMWGARFEALGEGLKLGISWRGGKDPCARRVRSTILDQWAGLFSLGGVHFINLQYGDCADELREAKEKIGVIIHDWEDADPLNDLDNFAAQIAALDLVISVDNSTVHMAGALGVSAWTLLPFSSDWRWMRGYEDTPWYPAMRLFRQDVPGDWESVFARVHAALQEAARKGPAVIENFTPSESKSYKSGIRDEFKLKSRKRVALVNDTSYWYHWGCTGTSRAIHQALSDRGYDINSIPVSGIYSCKNTPVREEDFDSLEVLESFAGTNRWVMREIEDVDSVVINGEGSLHGLGAPALNLLYLAYVSKKYLGKNVQIINHSCYPQNTSEIKNDRAWNLYKKVYSSLDFAAIREPVSFELMRSAGLPVEQSFDCLPLYINRNYQEHPGATNRIIIAGSVAWKHAGMEAFSSFIKYMDSLGYDIRVLTGANALSSSDDKEFVKALYQECPHGWKGIEAKSMEIWLDTIADAGLLISGRFHHTIAAAVLGTPFILLESNTPKNEGIARIFDSSPPLSYRSQDLLPLMIERSEKALASRDTGQKNEHRLLVDTLCKLAKRNFIGVESL